MSQGAVADDVGDGGQRRSLQGLIRLASGLLVAFAAFGFGSWFSGAASWIGFYAGARGGTLTGLAQAAAGVGFTLAVVVTLAWYRRRCRRGAADIPARAALAACLALPAGNICWAIFVDAIAYHYGEDIVRPAFDYAIMYVVLGGLLPLTVGIPWLAFRFRRRAPSYGAAA
jgi:hypothetical protein